MDTAEQDGISLEEPCHAVREFQITGLVRPRVLFPHAGLRG